MKPIAVRTFDPIAIARDSPPVLRAHNLEIVYRLAAAQSSHFAGPIVYSRWGEMPLPENAATNGRTAITASADYFTYDAAEARDASVFAWHVNFANYDLFSAYGSGLFAQDEMQVAEHPVLASLRELLLKENLSTLTVERGRPTPILVRGAERRVRIATDPNAAEERPNGLYGNQFARAKNQAIRKAVTVLNPPTISNIIAMEAPPGGSGEYTRHQIHFILSTAYTAFRATKLESKAASSKSAVAIHTGFWGCGAYGGNRTLMSILQLYAAKLAEIDHLAFHSGDATGVQQFETAREALARFEIEAPTTDALILHLTEQRFQWGFGNGT